ncbi:MAG: zinc ABC transporter substrate-binding protein [Tissierellia bacterium]|nr:zinc ABC transporter substrate-binding protein [Tissierellia bacterium]
MNFKKIRIVLVLALILILSACSTPVESKGDKPVVYASFYPIYDIVQSVAGDEFEVRSFMPPDKEAHLWEPSPKDIKMLSDAELLVVNGANMERWLDMVRDSFPDLEVLVLSDGVELITYKGAAAIGDFQYMASVELGEGKYEIEFGHTHEDIMRVAFIDNSDNLSKEELIKKGKEIMEQKGELVEQNDTIDVESDKVYGIEMGHEAGAVYYNVPKSGNWIFIADRISEEILPYELIDVDGENLQKEVLLDNSTSQYDKITYDPHSWLSIVNAKKYANSIQDKLTELNPNKKNTFRKNKLDLVDALTTMEYEYKEKFKDVRIREFVTTHHAYAYLARDFDIRQFPLQGLTSMEDPSLKTIKKAIDFCKYYDIDTIFYEYGSQKKGAATIANEMGGKTMPLASMEFVSNEQKKNGEKYIDLMRMNIENIYNSMR